MISLDIFYLNGSDLSGLTYVLKRNCAVFGAAVSNYIHKLSVYGKIWKLAFDMKFINLNQYIMFRNALTKER